MMMDTAETSADYSIPGMRIRQCRDGSPWALVIQTTRRQTEWVEELSDVAERISRPRVPTAIHYRDQFYRIDSVEETPSGWVYRMSVWPMGAPRMSVFELNHADIRANTIETQLIERDHRQAESAILWGWMLGWLPSAIQNDISETCNFNPADASRIQAFFQMFICLGFTWICLMNPAIGWFSFFATLEGAGRWLHTMITREPFGFTPIELAWRVVMRIKK